MQIESPSFLHHSRVVRDRVAFQLVPSLNDTVAIATSKKRVLWLHSNAVAWSYLHHFGRLINISIEVNLALNDHRMTLCTIN